MPANKNAMTRYKILDELLSDQYHNYSLDNLTDEVSTRLSELYPDTDGVVRRTIEKDIKYLEEEGPFLVEIERYTVEYYNIEKQKNNIKQCLKYKDPSFSIFKKEMTKEEEYLLRETFTILGQFEGLPQLMALENLRKSVGVREHTQSIISFTKNPLEGSNILGELFTTISQKQVIEIQYHTFSEPNHIIRITLYPYLLKEYNRRWFLFGTAETTGKLMCFGLERINKVIPIPSHCYQEFHGNINELFEDIIGVTLYEDSPIYDIIFWVSDVSKEYVLTKPIHESQKRVSKSLVEEFHKLYPPIHDGIILQIQCKYNYELIRELSSFGKELVVLKPSFIQDKVIRRIQDMLDRYQTFIKQR